MHVCLARWAQLMQSLGRRNHRAANIAVVTVVVAMAAAG
jgi:hypothetical protein